MYVYIYICVCTYYVGDHETLCLPCICTSLCVCVCIRAFPRFARMYNCSVCKVRTKLCLFCQNQCFRGTCDGSTTPNLCRVWN